MCVGSAVQCSSGFVMQDGVGYNSGCGSAVQCIIGLVSARATSLGMAVSDSSVFGRHGRVRAVVGLLGRAGLGSSGCVGSAV